MNSNEVKSLLSTYRGHRGAEPDEELSRALEQVERDPELRAWFERQQAFHRVTERSLRDIPVPAGLRDRILAERKVIPVKWWLDPILWAAAAAIVVAIMLASRMTPTAETAFAVFRSRMIGTVLRQYAMDVVTTNAVEVRQFLSNHQAPADYVLPLSLARVPMSGAGLLKWQGQPVSMVCFNGGRQGTLFLFVADAPSGMAGAPEQPHFTRVNSLATVSWTNQGKIYLLAAHGSEESLKKYL